MNIATRRQISPLGRFRGRRALIAASLAASLVFAACGSDDNDTPAAAPTTAAASQPALTAPAPGADGPSTAGSSNSSMEAPFGPACSAVPADGAGSFAGMAKDPAATAASNNPVLSTLVSAVAAAGLVDTLNGPGPFTIFAPTNDAFAKIDKATLDALLADPAGDLTNILTYHVVAGKKLDADALLEAGSVETVNGQVVKITGMGQDLMVNGANVVCGNVETANAKVFIIDTVLLPEA